MAGVSAAAAIRVTLSPLALSPLATPAPAARRPAPGRHLVVREELADFRRSRFIVVTMAIFPVIFLAIPTAAILTRSAPAVSPGLTRQLGFSLLYLLLVPIVIPAVSVAYAVFGLFLLLVRLGASPAVATAVWQAPEVPAEAVFIPLLAGWAIWVGLAISARVSDLRAAQQLGTVRSLPPVALAALMSFGVISPTFGFAALLAGGLLLIDGAAYLLVSRLFNRERLITGAQPEGAGT